MKIHHYLTTVAVAGSVAAASLLPTPTQAIQLTKSTSYPAIGTVVNMTNGDRMCYVDIAAGGKVYHLGADFSICNQPTFLKQKVRLTYKIMKVNDCQSAEPCGKSRRENLIIGMKVISAKY
jgi:hypothetical protein